MTRGDLSAVILFLLEFGYGFPFWLFFAVMTYPFAAWGGDIGLLASGRVFSAFFGSGAIVVVCHMMMRASLSAWFVILAGAAMAFTPGLILMYKPFSADTMSNFLIVSAGAIVLLRPLHRFRSNLFVIGALFAGAVATKPNAALEAPFFVVATLALIYVERGGLRELRAIFGDLATVAGGLLTYALWNLPLILSEERRQQYFAMISAHQKNNLTANDGRSPIGGLGDWIHGIHVYFGSVTVFGMALMAGLAAIAIAHWRADFRTARWSALSLLWIVLPLAYVGLTVGKVALWYLTLPMLFMLNGPASLFAASSTKTPAGVIFRIGAILIVAAQLIFGFSSYQGFATHRWHETETPKFQDMERIRYLFMGSLPSDVAGISILTDPYVTIPLDKLRRRGVRVRTSYAADIDNALIEETQPNFIIINLSSYPQHRGDPAGTLDAVREAIAVTCDQSNLCYAELLRSEIASLWVFERTWH